MGVICNYRCSNCSRVKGSAFLGVGMQSYMDKTRNGLYGCQTCGILFEGQYSFLSEPPLIGQISNPCPKCGGESYELELKASGSAEPGEEMLTEDKCPHCKTGNIILKIDGFWD